MGQIGRQFAIGGRNIKVLSGVRARFPLWPLPPNRPRFLLDQDRGSWKWLNEERPGVHYGPLILYLHYLLKTPRYAIFLLNFENGIVLNSKAGVSRMNSIRLYLSHRVSHYIFDALYHRENGLIKSCNVTSLMNRKQLL